jgi:hypothetical protein
LVLCERASDSRGLFEDGQVFADDTSTAFGGLLLNCTRSRTDRRFKSVDVVRDVLLSIDEAATPVQSAMAVDLVARLDSEDPLTSAELRTLAEFLEDIEDRVPCGEIREDSLVAVLVRSAEQDH